MKVIDLLNKIANGEDIPKRIMLHCEVFKETRQFELTQRKPTCYREIKVYNEQDDLYLMEYLTEDMLNDVITILDDKKIKPLTSYYDDILGEQVAYVEGSGEPKSVVGSEVEELLIDKINEIIDYINTGSDSNE